MIDLSSRRVWVPDDDDSMMPLEAPHPIVEDLHSVSSDFFSLSFPRRVSSRS